MVLLTGHTGWILGAVCQCKGLRKNIFLETKLMLLGLSTVCSTIFKFAFPLILIRYKFKSCYFISSNPVKTLALLIRSCVFDKSCMHLADHNCAVWVVFFTCPLLVAISLSFGSF